MKSRKGKWKALLSCIERREPIGGVRVTKQHGIHTPTEHNTTLNITLISTPPHYRSERMPISVLPQYPTKALELHFAKQHCWVPTSGGAQGAAPPRVMLPVTILGCHLQIVCWKVLNETFVGPVLVIMMEYVFLFVLGALFVSLVSRRHLRPCLHALSSVQSLYIGLDICSVSRLIVTFVLTEK